MPDLIVPGRKPLIYPDPRLGVAISSAVSTHEAAGNPHPAYATDTDLSDHVAAADPHTGYMLESAFPGWANWTPSYTNLTVGSGGTTIARYLSLPPFGLVFCQLRVILGTGFSIGDVRLTLPITASITGKTALSTPLGTAMFLEVGVANNAGAVLHSNDTECALRCFGTATAPDVRMSALAAAVPFTWAAGHEIHATWWYEAA